MQAMQLTFPAGNSILQLSSHGSVEEQMKAAVPDWQQMLCSSSGQPAGHPTCLIISPAALGAIAMIKSFPTFNQVCVCRRHCVNALHADTASKNQLHPTRSCEVSVCISCSCMAPCMCSCMCLCLLCFSTHRKSMYNIELGSQLAAVDAFQVSLSMLLCSVTNST